MKLPIGFEIRKILNRNEQCKANELTLIPSLPDIRLEYQACYEYASISHFKSLIVVTAEIRFPHSHSWEVVAPVIRE